MHTFTETGCAFAHPENGDAQSHKYAIHRGTASGVRVYSHSIKACCGRQVLTFILSSYPKHSNAGSDASPFRRCCVQAPAELFDPGKYYWAYLHIFTIITAILAIRTLSHL
jgi:hypothetical protein